MTFEEAKAKVAEIDAERRALADSLQPPIEEAGKRRDYEEMFRLQESQRVAIEGYRKDEYDAADRAAQWFRSREEWERMGSTFRSKSSRLADRDEDA